MNTQSLNVLITERNGTQTIETIRSDFLTSNRTGSFRFSNSLVSHVVNGLLDLIQGRKRQPLCITDKNGCHRSVPNTAHPRDDKGRFKKINR